MKYKIKKTVTLLVAASLLLAFGCNKRGEAVFGAVQQASAQASADDWDKSIVNDLLKYVPEDSAMVYASTRAIDLDSPAMQAYLKKNERMMRDKSDRLKLVGDVEQTILAQLYDALIGLASNYEKAAPDWGLDPKGRADALIYMTEQKVVTKLSVVDGLKVKAKANDLLKSFDELSVTEVQVDDQNWMLIHDRRHEAFSFALHFGPKILTASLIFDVTKEKNDLNELLQPAGKPLSKEALGELSAQTAGLGFMDNVKALSLSLNPNSDLAKMLKIVRAGNESALILSQWLSLVEAFPRIDFEASTGENELYLDSIININDDEIININDDETVTDLQFLLGQRIGSDTHQGSPHLGAVKGMRILSKWGNAISQMPYISDKSGFIDTGTGSFDKLPALTHYKRFKCKNNSSSLGVSIEPIDFRHKIDEEISLSDAHGAEHIDTVELIKNLLGTHFKQLKTLKFKKNVISTFAVSELVSMPPILQALRTNNDPSVSNDESIDDSQVSRVRNSAFRDIIKLRSNYSIFKKVEEGEQINYTFDLNIGVFSNSIRLRSIIHF